MNFRFLLSASYFLSNAPNVDDGLQLWQGGERMGLQPLHLCHDAKEAGGLGGVRETGRG